MGRVDVTDLLTQAGLDPFAISLSPPSVSPAGDRAAFDKLVTLRAVTRLDDDYLAKWSARRTASWPVGSIGEHIVVLRYTARPGFGLTTLAMLGRTSPLSTFCLTQAALAAKLGADGKTEFVARAYTLPAGVDGRAGALTTNIKASFAAFCGLRGEA